MTGKPRYAIEELLSRYETYDARRRKPPKSQVHPIRDGFIRGFEDDTEPFGMSKQSCLNYQRSLNLPWPFLPEDLDALVFVVFGQPPFNLTWVRQSVVECLGYQHPDELVGRPALEILRRGVRFSDKRIERVRRLKTDNSTGIVTIEHTHLVTANDLYLPTRLDVRYCGARADRFYFCGEVLGEPYAPNRAADVFNVYPDLVFEMKTRAHSQMVAELARARTDPELLRQLIDRAIGTYRPPPRLAQD